MLLGNSAPRGSWNTTCPSRPVGSGLGVVGPTRGSGRIFLLGAAGEQEDNEFGVSLPTRARSSPPSCWPMSSVETNSSRGTFSPTGRLQRAGPPPARTASSCCCSPPSSLLPTEPRRVSPALRRLLPPAADALAQAGPPPARPASSCCCSPPSSLLPTEPRRVSPALRRLLPPAGYRNC